MLTVESPSISVDIVCCVAVLPVTVCNETPVPVAGKPDSMGPSSLPIKTELNTLAASLAKTIDALHQMSSAHLAANNAWGPPSIAGDRIIFEGWGNRIDCFWIRQRRLADDLRGTRAFGE